MQQCRYTTEPVSADKMDPEPLALDAMFDDNYRGLRRTAGVLLESQRKNHTLSPTALVHEAFVRLLRHDAQHWNDSRHFFAAGARAMRHVLVDHARGRKRAKRGGHYQQVPLDSQALAVEFSGFDLLHLSDAIDQLATIDARQGEIVELRCFGGLTILEIAESLGISRRSVQLEWRMAAAWLRRKLDLGSEHVNQA